MGDVKLEWFWVSTMGCKFRTLLATFLKGIILFKKKHKNYNAFWFSKRYVCPNYVYSNFFEENGEEIVLWLFFFSPEKIRLFLIWRIFFKDVWSRFLSLIQFYKDFSVVIFSNSYRDSKNEANLREVTRDTLRAIIA